MTNEKLTREQLLAKFAELAKDIDCESAHVAADKLLVEYLDDDEIATAYNKICKWYA